MSLTTDAKKYTAPKKAEEKYAPAKKAEETYAHAKNTATQSVAVAPTATGTGKTTTTVATATAPDNTAYLDYLHQQALAQENARNTALQAGISGYEAQRESLVADKENAARAAYVRQQRNLQNLPLQLAKSGINGGLAETNLVRVNTRYGQEMAGIENAFGKNNADIDAAIAALKANSATGAANAQATYYGNLAAAALKSGSTSSKTTTSTSSGTSGSAGGGTANSTATAASAPKTAASTATKTVSPTASTATASAPSAASRRAQLANIGLSAAEINAILRMEGYL